MAPIRVCLSGMRLSVIFAHAYVILIGTYVKFMEARVIAIHRFIKFTGTPHCGAGAGARREEWIVGVDGPTTPSFLIAPSRRAPLCAYDGTARKGLDVFAFGEVWFKSSSPPKCKKPDHWVWI